MRWSQLWFHSGNEFTTQAAWNDYDNKLKEQACIKDRSDVLSGVKQEIYLWPNRSRSLRKVVWLCDGAEYSSPDAYATTRCGAPPADPPPPPLKDHCKGFEPHPICRYRPYLKDTGMCKCV